MNEQNKGTKYSGIEIKEEQQFESKETQVGQEAQRKAKRVVSKPVSVKKQGRIERFTRAILGPDGLPRIGAYITQNVVGPAIKDTVVKSIQDGISMMVYGSDIPRNENTTYRNNNNRNTYNNYSQPYRQQPKRTNNQQNQQAQQNQRYYQERDQVQRLYSGAMLDNYLIDSADEATTILNGLNDNVYEYGNCTVAAYYEMIGLQTVFTDSNYGWDDLSRCRVRPMNGKFVIDLPPVIVL